MISKFMRTFLVSLVLIPAVVNASDPKKNAESKTHAFWKQKEQTSLHKWHAAKIEEQKAKADAQHDTWGKWYMRNRAGIGMIYGAVMSGLVGYYVATLKSTRSIWNPDLNTCCALPMGALVGFGEYYSPGRGIHAAGCLSVAVPCISIWSRNQNHKISDANAFSGCGALLLGAGGAVMGAAIAQSMHNSAYADETQKQGQAQATVNNNNTSTEEQKKARYARSMNIITKNYTDSPTNNASIGSDAYNSSIAYQPWNKKK